MRYQNLKSFQKHLASAAPRHLSRLYLISAADDHERRKALDAILSYLLTPDASPTHFNGGDLELRDLFDALESPSLFGGDSIVVLDEVEKIPKKNLQLLSDRISAFPGSCYLLIGARSKTPLVSLIEKEGVVFDSTDEKPWDKEKRLAEELSERTKNAGKRLAYDAVQLLFERLEKDAVLLENEIDKLICYAGDKTTISREDVLQICTASRTATLWQQAEEIVWEGKSLSPDAASFHSLLPALRSQLHLGMVLATLIEERYHSEKWNSFLPKLWPKTLEKRSAQAAQFGSRYFRKGLEKIFEIEQLSRGGSTQYTALIDLLRVYLRASQ